MMTFKQWFLKEVGFSTGCIAHFSVPLGNFTRLWPPSIEDSEYKPPEEHKKKKKKKEK